MAPIPNLRLQEIRLRLRQFGLGIKYEEDRFRTRFIAELTQ
jgi:hypothetical protein